MGTSLEQTQERVRQAEGRIDGVISLGGGGGTSIATGFGFKGGAGFEYHITDVFGLMVGVRYQQIGYGEGESFLFHRHADRFNARGHMRWSGRI